MNTKNRRSYKFFMALVLTAAVLSSGCGDSKDDSGDTGNESAILSGIEIDASAIYYSDYNETGIIVSVWNKDYESPVNNAEVRVNGINIIYSDASENYSGTFADIGPGDDVEFSISMNGETYSKTLAIPGQITITDWAPGTIYNINTDNTFEWTYTGGNAPDKISLLIDDDDSWKDIEGNNLSYVIPANTFDGTEAYFYAGVRAVNYYNDPDNRKVFEVFTSDEAFFYDE